MQQFEGNAISFLFYLNFILRIVYPYAIVRNTTERSRVPFTQFLPMVTSGKTVVPCHNQDINIGPVKIQSIPITTTYPPL